jgi:hypothetical protein
VKGSENEARIRAHEFITGIFFKKEKKSKVQYLRIFEIDKSNDQ